MQASDIKKLLEGVTPGKWEAIGRHVRGGYDKQMDDYGLSVAVDTNVNDRKDAAFIAAAPEIAQTCLDALARVDELEKEVLKGRVDERISILEDVQKLIIQHNGSPELMDGMMSLLKKPIGEWNPSIKPNECPIDGSCEACQ